MARTPRRPGARHARRERQDLLRPQLPLPDDDPPQRHGHRVRHGRGASHPLHGARPRHLLDDRSVGRRRLGDEPHRAGVRDRARPRRLRRGRSVPAARRAPRHDHARRGRRRRAGRRDRPLPVVDRPPHRRRALPGAVRWDVRLRPAPGDRGSVGLRARRRPRRADEPHCDRRRRRGGPRGGHRSRPHGVRDRYRRPAGARPERPPRPARRRDAPRRSLRPGRRRAAAQARGPLPAQPQQVPAAIEQGQPRGRRPRRPAVHRAHPGAPLRAQPQRRALRRAPRAHASRRRLPLAALRRPCRRRAALVVQHRAVERRPVRHARLPGLHVRRPPRRLRAGDGHVPGAQRRRPDPGLRQAARAASGDDRRGRHGAVVRRPRGRRGAHHGYRAERPVHVGVLDRPGGDGLRGRPACCSRRRATIRPPPA